MTEMKAIVFLIFSFSTYSYQRLTSQWLSFLEDDLPQTRHRSEDVGSRHDENQGPHPHQAEGFFLLYLVSLRIPGTFVDKKVIWADVEGHDQQRQARHYGCGCGDIKQ